jgi:signal transduction histidine kinase
VPTHRLSHPAAIRTALLALALLAIGLIPTTLALAAPSPVVELKPDTQFLSLASGLTWLDDPDDQLSFPAVLSEAIRGEGFQPLPGQLNRGFTAAASWLQLRLRRAPEAGAAWLLWLTPPYLDRVDVYVQTGPDPTQPDAYHRWRLGDHAPASERPMRHLGLVVPLRLADTEVLHVFIAVQSTSTHGLRATLYAPPAFATATLLHGAAQGGYTAIAFILGLVHLMLAARLREATYAWYGGFLIIIGICYMALQGWLGALLPAQAHRFSDLLVGFGVGIGFAALARFAMALFRTRDTHPWVHRYLQLVIALGLLTLLASGQPWYRYPAATINANGLVLFVVLVILAFEQMRQRQLASKLFFLAFLATAIGSLLYLLRIIGLLPMTELTLYALQYTTVVNMILMTMAISERVLAAEREAQQALMEAEGRARTLAEAMTLDLRANERQLERALATEQRALEEQRHFLDLICHEYRTPLATIRGNREILEMTSPPDWPGWPHLEVLKQAEGRLVEILDHQLQQYRLAYELGPEAQPQDPFALLAPLLAEARILWSERTLRLDAPPPSAARVRLDQRLFRTALFNLIENAHKYAPAGTEIELRASLIEARVEYRVSNPLEIPLAPDALRAKYARGPNAIGIRGLGLGLDLTARIAATHGGELMLQTHAADTFAITLSLPLCQPP